MNTSASFVDRNITPVQVTRVGSDDCLIEIEGQRFLLSYDDVYDLGLRLAMFIQNTTGDANPQSLQ